MGRSSTLFAFHTRFVSHLLEVDPARTLVWEFVVKINQIHGSIEDLAKMDPRIATSRQFLGGALKIFPNKRQQGLMKMFGKGLKAGNLVAHERVRGMV